MRDDELRDLRPLRPDSYVARSPLWSGPELVAFEVRDPGDFDWIERMILTHGYYEHEGVWVSRAGCRAFSHAPTRRSASRTWA